ncbi:MULTISPECIES: hypothetical protein [unclassified Rossellomorea]|uniref:hypothetical protein n=1 Tax=unclassified Rossellomorea TaxID=2837526 RepID=UPI00263528B0|nr:hypothetical protein [uncultured Rossellomorea sp.]
MIKFVWGSIAVLLSCSGITLLLMNNNYWVTLILLSLSIILLNVNEAHVKG